MSTNLNFIRDISGTVSNILPISDETKTLSLAGSETTSFFNIPTERSAYVIVFKYASNKLEDLTANRVNIDVRNYPYPPSDNTYSNPVALLVPGGVRIYASLARPGVDTDVLIHASLYGAPGTIGGPALQQGEAELVSIGIVPETANVAVGNTCQFTAYGFYSDETFRDITTEVDWRADLEEVATIGLHTGLLTAVSEGYVEVDAVMGSITSNIADVHVTAALIKSLDITPKNKNINAGSTQQYICTATYTNNTTRVVTTNDGLFWYIANDDEGSLAIIDQTGLCSANSAGTALVDAYCTQTGGDTIIAPPVSLFINSLPVPSWKVGDEKIKDTEKDEDGWFVEDGREISRTQFVDLYNFYIQNPIPLPMPNRSKYGEGNNPTYYNPSFPNRIVLTATGTAALPGTDAILGDLGNSGLTIEQWIQPGALAIYPVSGAALAPYVSTGCILHYTQSINVKSEIMQWYIVFRLNGVTQIPSMVPTGCYRIIYVDITDTMTMAQVIDAISTACNYFSFKLPSSCGYSIRMWDNGFGIDTMASSRDGRADGLNGDHVGTIQDDNLIEHEHAMPQIRTWLRQMKVNNDVLDVTTLKFAVKGPSESYGPGVNGGTDNTAEAGTGSETTTKNISRSILVKY
ncbi:hypothetical protein HGB13_00305 [bacterium]|nr:hypothetical protein [bacterium]